MSSFLVILREIVLTRRGNVTAIDENNFLRISSSSRRETKGETTQSGLKREWIDPLYLNYDFRILIFRVSFRSSSLRTKCSGYPKQNNLSAATEINVCCRGRLHFFFLFPLTLPPPPSRD